MLYAPGIIDQFVRRQLQLIAEEPIPLLAPDANLRLLAGLVDGKPALVYILAIE